MANPGGTYSGGGQTTAPVAANLDISTSGLSLAGARVISVLMTYLQLQQLQNNLILAQSYYTLNHQDFDFWNTTYNPKMLSALNESKARQYYTNGNYTPQFGQLDYKASTGRGQSRASLRIDKEWLNSRRKISPYNIGHGRRVDYKYGMARLNSELEGWNLGFRYEDNRKMLYDEQRHAHQAEILNLGIGAGNAAREGLATSVKGLSEARSQKAGIYGALSNGLSTYAGFQDATQGMRQESKDRSDYQKGGRTTGLDVSKDQMQLASQMA
jgi:hypothetical protein